jgi:hypothetical protein
MDLPWPKNHQAATQGKLSWIAIDQHAEPVARSDRIPDGGLAIPWRRDKGRRAEAYAAVLAAREQPQGNKD